tara:strand:+ start:15835 stop:16851 length:1017 start_codon:yes stop_codon:yes gene_type:complete
MPKGFIKNIKLKKNLVGVPRRQELLDNIDDKGTFLPRGVGYQDMDASFLDFTKNHLELTIGGDKVPVIFLTTQRWNEFSKTWQHSDKYKNIKMPFITMVRKPDVQVGTNQAGNWNIPGNRGYTYIKVPTFEGGRKGVDTYKIPQPTAVDISYEVRLFCNRMKDLNKLHTIIQKTFNARQHYLYVNEHPMPLLLDTVSDESSIDDFENRRFYVQLFSMKLLGYLLSEEDFKVIPTVNRLKVSERILPLEDLNKTTNTVERTYKIVYNDLNTNEHTITTEADVTFDRIGGLININDIVITVGVDEKLLPFSVSSGTEVKFTIVRDNITSSATFVAYATNT